MNDGTIALLKADGSLELPTALEIYHAEFGGNRVWRGTTNVALPSANLPDIRFHKEPASAAVLVYGTYDGANLRVGVQTPFGFQEISGERDQVVVSSNWYPVHLSSVEAATAWVGSLGAAPGQPVTVGALIALRMSTERPCILVDEVSGSPARMRTFLDEIPGLNASLYDYQKDGINFLRTTAEQGVGCILGDQMGLGKTLQVIALLQLECNANRGPCLVVAPATLLENWRRELSQFAPQLSVLLHAGASRAGVATKLGGYDITLASYETVIRDEVLLSKIDWNVLALDEAQNIKNPAAQRSLAVKRLPRRVSLAVTGTPLENTLEDLWSVTDFVLPGLLGGLTAFREKFEDAAADAARLAPILAPVLLRRLVVDVAQDLPEKIEIPQAILMPPALAEIYEFTRTSILSQYGPAGGLVSTSKLRMLCAHPSLVGPWTADPAEGVPKYLRTIELLEEVFASGEKALVFSTYQGVADLLERDMPVRFPGGFFRSIDGRVGVPDRQSIVDEFFAFNGFGALFLNPKAAGSGLNITAANHVIHYNPEWNPALTAQASARAFRRKQERPVTIHHLYYANTIEEVVREAAVFKQSLAAGAVTGHDGDVSPSAIARALKISPIVSNRREI